MATPKSQRIAIGIIMVVMIVGTLGSFAVMMLDTQNSQNESQAQQEASAQYQQDYDVYQEKLAEQADQLSEIYYPAFKKYADLPAKFEIDSVTKLVKKDLKVGTGEKVTDTTSFAAYYIGWNPDGKVFDQSILNDALKSPYAIDGLGGAMVIDGWKQGIVGMKIGGIRQLTIPSDLAYGEGGAGNDIPPNTPIKFVVMVVEQPEKVPEPVFPQILQQQL